MDPAKLDHARLEAYLAELERENYENGSGRKASLATGAIGSRYPEFEDPAWAAAFRARTDESDLMPDELSEARKLRRFFEFEKLARTVAAWTDEAASLEASLTVPFEGAEIPYRETAVRLANLSDVAKRRALAAARLPAVERLTDLQVLRLRAFHEEAVRAGYPSYRAMCERLLELDFEVLASSCEGFLRRTEASYLARLEEHARIRLELAPDALWQEDFSRLLRFDAFDRHFPADRLETVFRACAAQLGMDLGALPNLSVDAEDRPGKSARAFCATIRVPAEIILVVRPQGGCDDWDAFFHEGGHALHYALTNAALPVADRCLGEPAASEGYAFLFQSLLREPSWLVEHVGLSWEDASAYAEAARFREFALLRRYCAKLIFESELHRAGGLARLDHAAERYAELLSEATGFRYRAEHFAVDMDDHFYSAGYLRAWMFESGLRRLLRKLYGGRFWAHPGAGEFLRGLFSWGDRYTAEEIAEQNQFAPLGVDSLEIELA